MPSPVGHALGGIAAGWLVNGRGRQSAIGRAAMLAVAGIAADFDLLAGWHRGPSHSLVATVLAGAAAWILARRAEPAARWRLALAVAAAYGSHVLLDWLGSDTRPPIGIPALWPLSRANFESPLHLFPAVSRRYWLAEFWTYNLRAVAREVLILGPIAAAVLILGRRAR
jgi:hypothetical protein